MCRDGRDARRCARRHRRPAAPATPADAATNTGTPRWGSGAASVAGGGGGSKRTRPPSRAASYRVSVRSIPLLAAASAAMDGRARRRPAAGRKRATRGGRVKGVKTPLPRPPSPRRTAHLCSTASARCTAEVGLKRLRTSKKVYS